MIVASLKDRPEFVPPGQDLLPEPKVYVFRVPSLLDKARFEREIVASGGRRVGIFDTLGEIENAVRALLTEDDPDRATALVEIDAYRARLIAAAEAVQVAKGDADREAALTGWSDVLRDPRMNELTIDLRAHWRPLREIEADALVYPAIRGITAARLFLVGWRGFDARLRRDARGVHDESLALIPAPHVLAIAGFADSLFAPTETERGNSVSPPGGGSAQEPSLAVSTRH